MLPCINDSLGDRVVAFDDDDGGGEHDDDGGDLQQQTIALLQTRLDCSQSLFLFHACSARQHSNICRRLLKK